MPGPFPGQLARAFTSSSNHDFCVVVEARTESVVLRSLRDGSTREFSVGDVARLAAVLHRSDLCILDGHALAAVNPSIGALVIASGPAKLPKRVAINAAAARLEGGCAVELLADGPDQPTWHAFTAREIPGPNDVPP